MSDPEKAYHFELVCSTETLAGDLRKLINSFVDLSARVVQRRKSYIVYVKEADQIADLLNIMGAHQKFFEFEEIRMTKEMRNKANRLSNCDNANLDKTMNTALRQIAAIDKIQRVRGLSSLPPKLRDAAILRRDNPDATLQELADLCTPPLKKSGLNNRLRRIEEIAEKITE